MAGLDLGHGEMARLLTGRQLMSMTPGLRVPGGVLPGLVLQIKASAISAAHGVSSWGSGEGIRGHRSKIASWIRRGKGSTEQAVEPRRRSIDFDQVLASSPGLSFSTTGSQHGVQMTPQSSQAKS